MFVSAVLGMLSLQVVVMQRRHLKPCLVLNMKAGNCEWIWPLPGPLEGELPVDVVGGEEPLEEEEGVVVN